MRINEYTADVRFNFAPPIAASNIGEIRQLLRAKVRDSIERYSNDFRFEFKKCSFIFCIRYVPSQAQITTSLYIPTTTHPLRQHSMCDISSCNNAATEKQSVRELVLQQLAKLHSLGLDKCCQVNSGVILFLQNVKDVIS